VAGFSAAELLAVAALLVQQRNRLRNIHVAIAQHSRVLHPIQRIGVAE